MPLQFDMPLEKLSTYAGLNRKPADFDRFWEDGMAEVGELPSAYRLEEADFQTSFAICEDLFFEGVGGAEVHARVARPRQQASPSSAVCLFHGYTSPLKEWFDLMPYPAAGVTVAMVGVRGQYGRSRDVGGHVGWTQDGHLIRGLGGDPEALFYRNVFLDCAQFVTLIMSLPGVDPDRVGTGGASQGGGLSLVAAALVPQVKRVASVFPFLCDYRRAYEMDLDVLPYRELSTWFRRFDPQHKRVEEVFEKLGYIDVQHFVDRIQAEVKMSVGLMDQVCPPSTQFAAYNKIVAPKSLELYPDYGHEDLPGQPSATYQWMLEL